jgi:hypothetical protein
MSNPSAKISRFIADTPFVADPGTAAVFLAAEN